MCVDKKNHNNYLASSVTKKIQSIDSNSIFLLPYNPKHYCSSKNYIHCDLCLLLIKKKLIIDNNLFPLSDFHLELKLASHVCVDPILFTIIL